MSATLIMLSACDGSVAVDGVEATPGRVVDGDTLDFVVDGTVERVRLIGIDAPERGECGADEATAALAALIDTGPILLESDTSDRDEFGRLLRYAWVGEVFVNEVLVEDGLAIARRYPPDTRRAELLDEAQRRAREAGRGIWSASLCGDGAAAPVVIGDLEYDPPGDDLLVGEWVEFTNTGHEPVEMTGWTVRDASAAHRYEFPAGFTLAPGATVRLHTGCGDDSAALVHWCTRGSAVWNNDGDTVFLQDPTGSLVASRTYP